MDCVDFYDEYKPLRNYMRRFDLAESLVDLWRYSLHVIENLPLPGDYSVGIGSTDRELKKVLFPWDVDILAKECVLNAGTGGDRTLRKRRDLAVAINHLRRLDGVAFTDGGSEAPDVLLEIHRIAHRQFLWQTRRGANPMVRALKVFGQTAVEEIVVLELGMTTQQFMQLGLALCGHFYQQWGMSINQDYGMLGISREVSSAFLDRISCPIEQLRAETIRRQSYDRDWLYTWNPMEAWPLIRFDPDHPDRVLCPIPRYLSHRASLGVFYDLIKSTGFDNPYGNAFQAYIGEVARKACPPPHFTLRGEESYHVAGQKIHGVDWVLSDSTGHLFIECKTKRLTLDARSLSDPAALQKDLTVMATAIVQHYQNILRALEGKTAWKPDGLPVYPLVLTLEDWFIFSPQVQDMLAEHVRRILAEHGIADQRLEQMPFMIASAHEFEIASQIIAQIGIALPMSKKAAPESRMWSFLPFFASNFPEKMQKVNWLLFEEDWERLTPTASK
jgi:hypothetical protein